MQKQRHTSAGQLAQDSTAYMEGWETQAHIVETMLCHIWAVLFSQAQRLVGKQALSTVMEVKATIYRICHFSYVLRTSRVS